MINGPLIGIFLSTFVLEDVALAAAISLITQGKISFYEGLVACFAGIFIGDLLLFLLGRGAHKAQFIKNFLNRITAAKNKSFDSFNNLKVRRTLDFALIVSRFIPGTRFITYVSAGYLSYPFLHFFLITFSTVLVWVAIALSGGSALLAFINQYTENLILGVFGLIFAFVILRFFVKLCFDPWKRKSFPYSIKKWLYFEFWPPYIFYFPLIPFIAALILKYRSLKAPLLANPSIKNGGFVGESKWDFLQALNSQDPATLKTVRLKAKASTEDVATAMIQNQMAFPLIFKPDVGQRGYGVRVVRNKDQAKDYMNSAKGEVLLQQLSPFQGEAGIFYSRFPSQAKGGLFSFTDKKFPTVTGDGKTSLGNLILKDPRAQLIAAIYFERLKPNLQDIPQLNEVIQLVECGNHCQGAIFLNGVHLITEDLVSRIDAIAKTLPHFYFGRLDIRYKDEDSLMRGQNFHIIEVNGAGSEATHIWDRRTPLLQAYKSLFMQWDLLFAIGAEVKATKSLGPILEKNRLSWRAFLKESFKVMFRKSPLSVSS